MPTKRCALNAMAKERLPALHVVALAKNPLSASQLASVRNATGLASAAATLWRRGRSRTTKVANTRARRINLGGADRTSGHGWPGAGHAGGDGLCSAEGPRRQTMRENRIKLIRGDQTRGRIPFREGRHLAKAAVGTLIT
jgi:hypothetical protein